MGHQVNAAKILINYPKFNIGVQMWWLCLGLYADVVVWATKFSQNLPETLMTDSVKGLGQVYECNIEVHVLL